MKLISNFRFSLDSGTGKESDEDMNIILTQVVIEKTPAAGGSGREMANQIENNDSKKTLDVFEEAKKIVAGDGNKNSTSSMTFGGMSLKDCHVSFNFNSK